MIYTEKSVDWISCDKRKTKSDMDGKIQKLQQVKILYGETDQKDNTREDEVKKKNICDFFISFLHMKPIPVYITFR